MSAEIYKNYIEGKSYSELYDVLYNSLPGTPIYEQVLEEIHRIQQDTSNTQVANLISEIQKLKEITDKNAESTSESARSSNKLARIAVWIAIATLITQIIFSTHTKSECRGSSRSAGDPVIHHSDCYLQFDLGLLGTYTFSLPDD